MEWFKKAWRGEELCWKVFWLYGLAGGTAWALAFNAFQESFRYSPPFKFTFVLLHLFYLVWVVVSLYRCAFNTGTKFLGYIVRLIAILCPLLFIVGVFFGGVEKGQMLIQAAQCKRVAIDANYADSHPDVLERCKSAGAKKRR